jgi:hypothetical protein
LVEKKREDACVGGPAIEMSVMADNSFSEIWKSEFYERGFTGQGKKG